MTVIGNDCGFVIATGTGPPRPGASSPGRSPVTVNAPEDGGGVTGWAAAGCSGLWMNHVAHEGRLGIPVAESERTQKVCDPVPRPT